MSSTIESVLQETRVFPPSPAFVKQANISGMEAYRKLVRGGGARFRGLLGAPRAEHAALVQALHQGAGRIARRRSSTGSTTAS